MQMRLLITYYTQTNTTPSISYLAQFPAQTIETLVG